MRAMRVSVFRTLLDLIGYDAKVLRGFRRFIALFFGVAGVIILFGLVLGGIKLSIQGDLR